MSEAGETAKFPYLFVVTYGRSGSTLLQGILNAIPDYCIRGENHGVLNHLRAVYGGTVLATGKFAGLSEAPSDAWYGIADVQTPALLADIRALMVDHFIRPPANTRCMGYKEIRYAPGMDGDLTVFVQFMETLFPGAGFIFNARDVETTAKSDFWKQHANPVEFLTVFRERMEKTFEKMTVKDGQSNAFWLNYEDYVDDPDALQSMFEFLGEPFDGKLIRDVLAKPHSANANKGPKVNANGIFGP